MATLGNSLILTQLQLTVHVSVKAVNWQGQERTALSSQEVNVVFLWKCSSFFAESVDTHPLPLDEV